MNRTRLGIFSTIIVIVEALIIGILTMVRTRYILLNFGSDVNAILQLAISLTSYLLLFESGMSAAFQFSMYKPLCENKKNNVVGLFNGLQISMMHLSQRMLIISFLVASIYSLFLTQKGVTYIEAFLILLIIFIRLIAPYIFTLHYKTLLYSMEKKYISDIIECIKNTLTIITELLLIKYTKLPLILILSFYIFYTFLSKFCYRLILLRLFGKEILNKTEINTDPMQMTKDIVIHRIAGLITSNTDAVLLSLFNSLNSVTIYTSFFTIINYPITLIIRIIDTMRATIAIKINANDKNAKDVFLMMISFEMCCILLIIPVFILLGNKCIELWIGNQYTTSKINILLLSLVAFHKMFIPVIYATRDGKGLFKETKKFSLYQAIINFIISLILVFPLGITGILIGTVISDFLILQPFNIKIISNHVFTCLKDIYIIVMKTILLLGIFISIESYIYNNFI